MMKKILLLVISASFATNHQQVLEVPVPADGEYHPPKDSDKRSPCPGFNTMANHGYLARDGRNIDADDIVSTFVQHYNLDETIGKELIQSAFDAGIGDKDGRSLSLDELSKHGALGHDASLVHNDYYFGDNWSVNQTLVKQLVDLQDDGYITVQSLGKARKLRQKQSSKENPEYDLDAKKRFSAYLEAAIIMAVLGGPDEKIPVAVIEDFLGKEKLPESYTKPENPITKARLTWLATKIGLSHLF